MAEVTLNTTTSIVDYLKSTGKASDYSSRESLYNSLGLNSRLGAYTGSASQNTAFLKTLSTQGTTPPPTTTTPSVSTPQPGYTTPSITPSTGPSTTPQTTSGGAYDSTGTIGNSGITATQALSSIPGAPDADTILNQVLNSPGFQNFQQGQQLGKTLATGEAEAQKAALETKSKADTQAFIDSIGRRGLFFSGETQTGLQALAESLASSKLGIDRKLAGELLASDLKTKGEIIDQVGKLVKDAQDGRKEAIAALEKVGLTVVGDQVLPTLAAQREERQIAAEERLAQTAAFNQEATLARLEMSASAAERAEAYLRLAEARAADGGDGASRNTLTLTETKSLGLPLSMVGMNQDAVIADLASPTPPQWFVDLIAVQPGVTGPLVVANPTINKSIQDQWEEFSSGVDARFSGESAPLIPE